MAHKKYHYYAVANGTEKGIFDDWERCRTQVDHYKGNRYKGFYSFEEAAAFVGEYMDREASITVEIGGSRTVLCVKDILHRNRIA